MTREPSGGISGILNLNKPTGVTSRRVVDQVVRAVGRRVKVGHAGTLDPLASGVLVVCLGPATRLIEYVQRQSKTYRTVIRLGARSDTLDADGAIAPVSCPDVPDFERIRAAVSTQEGTFLQQPPDFSALKIEGRRAYDLARAGETVVLAPRPVTIHSAEILSYDWPRLELEIVCEGGTYIRSVARDIGEALGCGGLVEVLVRTRIGSFPLDRAIDPESLAAETIHDAIEPPLNALASLTVMKLDAEQAADVAKGRTIHVSSTYNGEVALVGPDGALVAVGEADAGSGTVAPRRVLLTRP